MTKAGEITFHYIFFSVLQTAIAINKKILLVFKSKQLPIGTSFIKVFHL